MLTSPIHLCIVQPGGNVHALGFLDQARFFRHQFRRLGAQVSLGKNRLRHDALNFVFGAHAGFETGLTERFRCVFVNLEQLGEGGSRVSQAYLQLLAASMVVDYDAANVAAYRKDADVAIVSFGHAPYLSREPVMPIEERPVDLLFFGSMNERRMAMLQQIEAGGCRVAVLPYGIFGPERDVEIRRAKAVFNCHFYESARFEQARVFQCLSLGTPVISERSARAAPPQQFEDSVFWVAPDAIKPFFERDFRAPEFADAARAKLRNFTSHDVLDQYAEVLARAERHFATRTGASTPWRPERLHIGSGKDYMPGWFNVDILEQAQPDALLDLSAPLELPARIDCATVGPVELCADSLSFIYANNVLEHVGDLPRLMTNCLHLLKHGAQMLIEVPYEKALAAWQDPTHVRAFNERSWIYYAEWFWYLGWFESRFTVVSLEYLDERNAIVEREQASFMRVRLEKVATSAVERTIARAMRADFGGVEEDGEGEY